MILRGMVKAGGRYKGLLEDGGFRRVVFKVQEHFIVDVRGEVVVAFSFHLEVFLGMHLFKSSRV